MMLLTPVLEVFGAQEVATQHKLSLPDSVDSQSISATLLKACIDNQGLLSLRNLANSQLLDRTVMRFPSFV